MTELLESIWPLTITTGCNTFDSFLCHTGGFLGMKGSQIQGQTLTRPCAKTFYGSDEDFMVPSVMASRWWSSHQLNVWMFVRCTLNNVFIWPDVMGLYKNLCLTHPQNFILKSMETFYVNVRRTLCSCWSAVAFSLLLNGFFTSWTKLLFPFRARELKLPLIEEPSFKYWICISSDHMFDFHSTVDPEPSLSCRQTCRLVSAHLHLLQSLQFGHEGLDLTVLLRQHGLESLQLSRVGPGALELH